MSLNINRLLLAGNLTRDPETKFLQSGVAICHFGLAINSRYKTKAGEQKEETTFVDVECFGTTAENVAKYLTKGSPAFLEGKLKLDQWDDKATGQKRSKLKVVADTVQFLGTKTDAPTPKHVEAKEAKAAQAFAPGVTAHEDEPPFFADRNDSSWA